MNKIFVGCFLLLVGCCSPRERLTTTADLLTFSNAEIESKTWTNSLNQTIHFYAWMTIDITGGEELKVAKYADRETGDISCLDFYRVLQEVGFGDRNYILLAHDHGLGSVRSIRAASLGHKGVVTSINVVRDIPENTSSGVSRLTHSYWLDYAGGFEMRAVPLNNTVQRSKNKAPSQ